MHQDCQRGTVAGQILRFSFLLLFKFLFCEDNDLLNIFVMLLQTPLSCSDCFQIYLMFQKYFMCSLNKQILFIPFSINIHNYSLTGNSTKWKNILLIYLDFFIFIFKLHWGKMLVVIEMITIWVNTDVNHFQTHTHKVYLFVDVISLFKKCFIILWLKLKYESQTRVK